jgi:hypothetical protein
VNETLPVTVEPSGNAMIPASVVIEVRLSGA